MSAEQILLLAGIGCLIGAVIGGGLKWIGGIEVPVIKAIGRQILLGFLGVVLILVSGAISPESGNKGPGPKPVDPPPDSGRRDPPPSPSTREVRVANTAVPISDREWRWTVFVEADDKTLSEIECVDYTLHPTFSDPVKTVCTRGNQFALTATGWGTFEVGVRIIFTDRTEQRLSHMLRF